MKSKKKTAARSKKSAKKPKSTPKKAPKVEDTKGSRITVLIADDHSVVREGLVSLITRKTDMTVVGEAGNRPEPVHLWEHHHPHATLPPLRMPQLDAVRAPKEIPGNHHNPRTPSLTTLPPPQPTLP